jgi:hypothetical protein
MVDRERQPLDPDLDAARRVAFCLCLAERQLGITIQPDVRLRERCELILKRALGSMLDPWLYEVAFLVRKACKT